MISAARECGDPQNSFKAFHVAGTNGKGSVCHYLNNSLLEMGFRTGLYTSPHLIRFEERFLISGKEITESQWFLIYKDLQCIIERYSLTFFEATTLIAFELFRREGIEYAVIETGLGGRLDATNIIDPLVSIITSIGIDHTDYLGDTLEEIAYEKLGIVKNGRPLVITDDLSESVKMVVMRQCADKKSVVHFVSTNEVTAINESVQSVSFEFQSQKIITGLTGIHQISNSLLARKALHEAGLADDDAIVRGLAKTKIDGRFEIRQCRGKTVVFDVAHNPDAAKKLANLLKKHFSEEKITAIVGVMKDKDIQGIFGAFSQCFSRCILTRPAIDRAATPDEILLALNSLSLTIEKTDCVSDALKSAFLDENRIIVITGSFYTTGEAKGVLRL
jgi:dihydrofolate synthase/folylpolyglutamate synthase